MNASYPYSNSRGVACVFLLWACVTSACVEEQPGLSGTTSLRVEILSPSDLGSADMRLPSGLTGPNLTLSVTALDAQGNVDTGLTAPIDLYAHFLGSLSPDRNGTVAPATLTMTSGVATGNLQLDLTFGPTVVWAEDFARANATFATGASPTLWFREPFIEDISRPIDEGANNALAVSPLQGKEVTIVDSKHGTDGRMVVTGVYAQAYSVSDANCAALPCTADPFNHVLVYTFSQPRGHDDTAIRIGHTIAEVAGGVQEFNGLTELGFPRTVLTPDAPDESLVPDAVVVDGSWLLSQMGPTGMINLERLESALVAVDGATVCPLDDDFTTYGQWKLDVGNGCGGGVINVISQNTVPALQPATLVGQPLTRVEGILRAVNLLPSFNVWIMEPRRPADIRP